MIKKISPRTARYVLTPDGLNELAHRSYRYMKRTFSEVKTMSAAVESRIAQAKADGFTEVILYGDSDIAFIIEWACERVGLRFLQKNITERISDRYAGALSIIGELSCTEISHGDLSVFDVAEKI
jgi:hypothetical protein